MGKFTGSFTKNAAREVMKGVSLGSAYLENTMMTHMVFEEGVEVPEHSHPHEQITYIQRGAMEFVVDGERFTVGAGDWVTVPSFTLHSARTLEPTVAIDAWSPTRSEYK